MLNTKIISLFIAVIFLQCKSEKAYYGKKVQTQFIDDYKELSKLNEYKTFEYPEAFEVVTGIFVFGDYLLFTDRSSKNNFHVLDRHTHQYIKSIIPRGEGPYEYMNIWHPNLISEDEVIFMDPGTNKYGILHYSDITIEKIEIEKKKAKPKASFDWPLIIDDKIYFNDHRSSILTKADLDFTEVESLSLGSDEGFKELPNFSESAFASIFMSHLGNLIIRAYKYLPIIETYNIKTGETQSYLTPNGENQEFDQTIDQKGFATYRASRNETKLHFLDVSATSDYVYFLYSGQPFNPQPNMGSEGDMIIRVDKGGKIDKMFSLPFPITRFAVDRDEYLYARGNNAESFFRFSL